MAEVVQGHAVEMAEASETDEDCAGIEVALNILHPEMSGIAEEWEMFVFLVKAADIETVAGGEYLV